MYDDKNTALTYFIIVQERVAETFTSPLGRVVLAGDAAHVHAVNGGQGLNTGASDAFALSWRLGLVVKGFSKTLLQTYDDERRNTAKKVVEVAGKLVRSTLQSASAYLDLVEKNAANITGILSRNCSSVYNINELPGMGIVYAPSSVAVGGGSVGRFVAGARTPDFTLLKSAKVSVRFYELTKIGKFIVIVPSSMKMQLPTTLMDHVEVWKYSKKDDLFHVTTPAGAHLQTFFGFGENENEAVVVRPDLYTGFVGVDVLGYFEAFMIHP